MTARASTNNNSAKKSFHSATALSAASVMKAGLSNVAPCASRGVWLLLLLLVSSELMAAEARPKLNFRKRRETTDCMLTGTCMCSCDRGGRNCKTPAPEVTLVGDSPRVEERNVSICFTATNRALLNSLSCTIQGPGRTAPSTQDCTLGSANFTSLPNRRGMFTLVILGQLANSSNITLLERNFRLDSNLCSVHLINSGVSVENRTATIEWQATGPCHTLRPTAFLCRRDRGAEHQCTSPYVWSDLVPGAHRLTVRPAQTFGCRKHITRLVNFDPMLG